MIQFYIQFLRWLPRVRLLAEGGGEISVPIVDQFTKAVDHASQWNGDTKFLALVVLVLAAAVWYIYRDLKDKRVEMLELKGDLAQTCRERSDTLKSMEADLEQLSKYLLDERGRDERTKRKRQESDDRDERGRAQFLPSRRIPRRKGEAEEEEI